VDRKISRGETARAFFFYPSLFFRPRPVQGRLSSYCLTRADSRAFGKIARSERSIGYRRCRVCLGVALHYSGEYYLNQCTTCQLVKLAIQRARFYTILHIESYNHQDIKINDHYSTCFVLFNHSLLITALL